MRVLPFIALMLALTAVAQVRDTTAGGDNSQQISPPALLAGQSTPRGLVSDRPAANYFAGGIDITQLYTNNALLATNNTVGDLVYFIAPHVSLLHQTPRLSYSGGISAGFTVNRTLEQQNQATQTGQFDLSYGLTRFTTFRVSDSFTNSTGIWSGPTPSTTVEPGTGIGVVQQSNPALFTYGAFRTNDALAEVSHQFTRNGIGGIRGTHSFISYPGTPFSPVVGALYGGQTYSAEVFYNYQFSLRHWFGVTARGERFGLDSSVGRTDSASVLFLYDFNIRPTLSLSFFAGPEFSNTAAPQGLPAPVVALSSHLWSPATGAVFNWRGRKTGATVSFARQVSNGQGLPSAVTLTRFDAELLRQINPKLGAEVGFGYTDNVPIAAGQTIRTYSNHVQLNYRLARPCMASGGYSRDEDTSVGYHRTALANRFWVSVSYQFLRHLGR